jgi:tetratricopeptide (TPR) repeat protein
MEHKGRTRWLPELAGPLKEVDRLRRAGRYEQALAQIRELANAHPTQVRVLLEAGLTLAVWGRAPAEALEWFDRVLELAPGHLTTRLHRALTLARLGRHAEAVADFNTVESVGHRKLLILYAKRAESLRALGQHAQAERDWTR